MDNDRTKFWAILIAVMIAVSIAVTLVDMTIKAAILEESNALKRQLDGITSGSKSNQANSNGAGNHASNNGSNDTNDVYLFPARMESPTVRQATTRTTPPGPMAGTIEHSERMGNNGISSDNQQVDS